MFPTGGYLKGGDYGTDVNFPIPRSEDSSNPNSNGCLNRDARRVADGRRANGGGRSSRPPPLLVVGERRPQYTVSVERSRSLSSVQVIHCPGWTISGSLANERAASGWASSLVAPDPWQPPPGKAERLRAQRRHHPEPHALGPHAPDR